MLLLGANLKSQQRRKQTHKPHSRHPNSIAQVIYFNCDTGTSIKRTVDVEVRSYLFRDTFLLCIIYLNPEATHNTPRLSRPTLQGGTTSFIAPIYTRQLAVYVYRTDLRPGGVSTTSARLPSSMTQATSSTSNPNTATLSTVGFTTTNAASTSRSDVFPPGTRFTALYRVNAGGNADYTDSLGRLWSMDTGFVSGQAYQIASSDVNPEVGSLDVVYASERNAARGSTMVYRLDVGASTQAVRVQLHFCELLDSSAQIGDRIMGIYVEGELRHASFDAVAEFGFRVGGSLSFDIVMSVSES